MSQVCVCISPFPLPLGSSELNLRSNYNYFAKPCYRVPSPRVHPSHPRYSFVFMDNTLFIMYY